MNGLKRLNPGKDAPTPPIGIRPPVSAPEDDPMVVLVECFSDIAEYQRIQALYWMKRGLKEGLITQEEVDGEE